MSLSVTLIGAGGHATVVIAAARAMRLNVRRILDDRTAAWGGALMGVPIEGGSHLLEEGEPAHIAIGANRARLEIAARLPGRWVTIIHPFSWLDASVQPGEGSLICAGAVVQPGAVISPQSIINTGSSVDHDCILGPGVQVAPGAVLGGCVILEKGAFVGIGACLHQGAEMGPWSVLGGGAFLKGKVPEGEVWAGVPARLIKSPPY